jgi:hypothetical protein
MVMGKIGMGSVNDSGGGIAESLASYQLEPDMVPLSEQRLPFARLPVASRERITRRALDVQEARGRLTNAVRQAAGYPLPPRTSHVTIESHIDLTSLDEQLENTLINLCFEPDNFAKMQPSQYRYHFTLEYACAEDGYRARRLNESVLQAAAEAAGFIQRHGRVYGYVETEIYRSQYSFRQPYAEFDPRGLGRFPFDKDTFRHEPVPQTSAEVKVGGLTLDSRRAADIHVKIPGLNPAGRHPTAGDSLRSIGVAAPELRDQLQRAGFYEIVSQAGNFIYSAHFISLDESNQSYWRLVEFARAYGGITGIAREICTGIWRTAYDDNGVTKLAQVPPLLSAI